MLSSEVIATPRADGPLVYMPQDGERPHMAVPGNETCCLQEVESTPSTSILRHPCLSHHRHNIMESGSRLRRCPPPTPFGSDGPINALIYNPTMEGKDGSAKNFPCTERRNHVTPNSNGVARLPKACEARSSLKAAPCLRTKYRTRCLITDCLAGSKPAITNEASTDVVHSKQNAIRAAVAVTTSKAANLVLEQSTDAQHWAP